jgi:hypothetical protein
MAPTGGLVAMEQACTREAPRLDPVLPVARPSDSGGGAQLGATVTPTTPAEPVVLAVSARACRRRWRRCLTSSNMDPAVGRRASCSVLVHNASHDVAD